MCCMLYSYCFSNILRLLYLPSYVIRSNNLITHTCIFNYHVVLTVFPLFAHSFHLKYEYINAMFLTSHCLGVLSYSLLKS